MIEIEGIDPKHIVFVPNGIADLPEPTGEDVRAELGIPPGAPLVGTISILRPEKALDVLVRAAAELAPRFPGLQVLIAGDGWERPAIASLISSLGLDDTVKLIGFRRDVPDLLPAFDVAVSCSTWEGSPLAILESMDAARPIVASRVGGIPDMVEDGVHGILTRPGDERELADAIARLLEDRELAERLGAAARARRRAELTIDATVRTVERLYEDSYARTSRARSEGFAPRAPAEVARG